MNAREIVNVSGGDWHGDYGLAPGPGHSKRDRSLKVWDGPDGEPRFHSFSGEDWRAIKDNLRGKGLLPEFKPGRKMKPVHLSTFSSSQPSDTQKRWSDYAESVWQSCHPISGTALQYLQARHCVIPPANGDLRWHPNLKNKLSNWTGPALVARITDAVTNEPMTLHRTWITPSGTKAPISNPRLPLKGHAKQGGVIRLWPAETTLGIAEGIESALSAAHSVVPSWALIDAKNLSTFPVIDGINSLFIFADNDSSGTGQTAAVECANRWVLAGRDVKTWTPSTPDTDLNDWIRS